MQCLAAKTPEAAPWSLASGSGKGGAPAGARARTVLVVDDDPDFRATLREILTDEGLEVRTAANGLEALRELRADPQGGPCLILLDLQMPVMNGPQFLAALRAEGRATPVVIMSAWREEARALAAGGDYLAKPLELGELLDMVAKYCS